MSYSTGRGKGHHGTRHQAMRAGRRNHEGTEVRLAAQLSAPTSSPLEQQLGLELPQDVHRHSHEPGDEQPLGPTSADEDTPAYADCETRPALARQAMRAMQVYMATSDFMELEPEAQAVVRSLIEALAEEDPDGGGPPS